MSLIADDYAFAVARYSESFNLRLRVIPSHDLQLNGDESLTAFCLSVGKVRARRANVLAKLDFDSL